MMGMMRFRVATEFNVVSVMVTEDVQKEVERLKAEGRCLGCKEIIPEGDKVRLGQCSTCYGGTYRALKKGTKTFEELTANGQIASEPRGPKPKNNYTKSLRG
jgi:Zn finger protein HypA/HybF involved in hydrogenase expression